MKKWIPILLCALLLAGCGDDEVLVSSKAKVEKKWSYEVSAESLGEARKNFKTRIVTQSFEPDGGLERPPAQIFQTVYYPAADGEMGAYLTPDPGDGKKHPAAIWIHGGYGGIGSWFWEPQPLDNDQSGRHLREAGIVMMVPSFRGENDNPGQYQMFYGELDDLESARKYLASIPYVDPGRIYLIGHSTGGTTVLLGNEYVEGFRAAFSIGGVPDLELRIKSGGMSVEAPFDQKNQREFDLRSPRKYITSLKSPTFYFEGGFYYWPEFDEIAEIAAAHNIPFKSYRIKNGDHFNILHPVTYLITQKILADTEEKTNITFTNTDLKFIENNIIK